MEHDPCAQPGALPPATEKKLALENLVDAAFRVFDACFAGADDSLKEIENIYIPVHVSGSNIFITIEVGAKAAARNAIHTAKLKAGVTKDAMRLVPLHSNLMQEAADALEAQACALRLMHSNRAGWLAQHHDARLHHDQIIALAAELRLAAPKL